jgi:aminoglycoside phosphotransferase (APT) family kinase protein
MATRFSESVGRWVDLSPGDPTVTHNDYRLDNILFGVDEDGTYAAVVDWQTVGTGPGIADVSYFIGAGLVPELRRAVERDLVERYVTLLAATGIDTDPDDMWDAYRLTCPAGLVMAVFASTVVAPGERSDDMFLAMAERHALQMADLGVPAMLEAM